VPVQILDALCVLREASIIHCDLKPENILLCPGGGGQLKLIDFGSACFQGRTVYTYIQSRFYRSPEVVLGASYSTAIDMWSFGCVAAEMFLGLPLFPGASEHDLLGRILETLGPLPPHLLSAGKHTSKFFRRAQPPGTAAPAAAAPGGEATSSSSAEAAAETAAALAAADAAAVAAASGPHSVVCHDAAGVAYTLRDKDNFEAVNRVAVSQNSL
jgi:dual specificity protein kinase YAK1